MTIDEALDLVHQAEREVAQVVIDLESALGLRIEDLYVFLARDEEDRVRRAVRIKVTLNNDHKT